LIQLGNFLFFVVLIAHPLITALLLMWVSREARALRQEAHTHSKLGFVVVGGMVLTLLGGLFYNLFAMLGGGIPQVVLLPAMCAAVIVAIRTLFGLSRSRESTQARPKDASPSDVDLSGEPGGDRG
jgi:uncharacterized membrane protein